MQRLRERKEEGKGERERQRSICKTYVLTRYWPKPCNPFKEPALLCPALLCSGLGPKQYLWAHSTHAYTANNAHIHTHTYTERGISNPLAGRLCFRPTGNGLNKLNQLFALWRSFWHRDHVPLVLVPSSHSFSLSLFVSLSQSLSPTPSLYMCVCVCVLLFFISASWKLMLSLSLPPLTSLSLSLCRCLPERCLSMCVCVRAGIEYFVALLPVAHCQLLPLFASSRLVSPFSWRALRASKDISVYSELLSWGVQNRACFVFVNGTFLSVPLFTLHTHTHTHTNSVGACVLEADKPYGYPSWHSHFTLLFSHISLHFFAYF